MRKVAIYDSQFLSRLGIKIALEDHEKTEEIVVFDTSRNIAEQVAHHNPNLLILEYLGEFVVQAETTYQLKQNWPELSILVISEDNDAIQVNRHIKAGVDGYLTKSCSLEEIQTALEVIDRKGRFFCKKISALIKDARLSENAALSDREMQIIKYIGRGLASSVIALKLGVSIHTINSHRKNILKKLGLKSPAQLIIYAMDKGWLKPQKADFII